ncbi:MAG: hypothetical protein JOZ41_15020 [Chloroflexi bacterium]|nr:hypothetical protein [Chloroflexota bacterium]
MSYGLYILSQRPPTEVQIRAFLSLLPNVSISGSLSEPQNLVIEAEASEGWVFIIDPPWPFDADDPFGRDNEEVRDCLVPQPAWSTFISVPYCRQAKGPQAAYSLAQTLARDNAGIVWDPQTEVLANDEPEAAQSLDSYSGMAEVFPWIDTSGRNE